jgi:hypothetical protein
MPTVLPQNELKALQGGLQRFADALYRMRIPIPENGYNLTVDFLAELQQLSSLP